MSGKPPDTPEEEQFEKQVSRLNLELSRTKSRVQIREIRDQIFVAEQGRWTASASNPWKAHPWQTIPLQRIQQALGRDTVFLEYVVWNTVPPELVGRWVVSEGPDRGQTLDFHRGGTLIATVTQETKVGVVEARIRVDGKKITATLTNQITGERGTRTQTIRHLDARNLVLEAEGGMVIKLHRPD